VPQWVFDKQCHVTNGGENMLQINTSIKGGQLVGSQIGVSMCFSPGTVSSPISVVMSCFGY